MKNSFLLTLILLSSFAIFSLTGCGDNTAPKSMTDGVEMSEIEAYEKAQREMEADAMGEMDETSDTP